MNIIFLSGFRSETRKRLQRVLEYLLPRDQIKYIRTIRALEETLRASLPNMMTTVILNVDKQKLASLLSIKDLLEDTNLILILGEKDEETVALGHRLRPRFITYADSDFLDIASVVMKMKEKISSDGLNK